MNPQKPNKQGPWSQEIKPRPGSGLASTQPPRSTTLPPHYYDLQPPYLASSDSRNLMPLSPYPPDEDQRFIPYLGSSMETWPFCPFVPLFMDYYNVLDMSQITLWTAQNNQISPSTAGDSIHGSSHERTPANQEYSPATTDSMATTYHSCPERSCFFTSEGIETYRYGVLSALWRINSDIIRDR